MSVREFDGTDDFVLLSIGAIPAAFPFGSMWVVLWSSNFAVAKHILVLGSGATSNAMSLGTTASGQVRVVNSGNTNRSGSTVLTNSRWHIIGFSKTTGTTTPRAHIWDAVAGTWTHEDVSGTQADNTEIANDRAAIGAGTAGGQPFAGRIVAAGVKQGVALSDGDFETLSLGVNAWFALAPNAVWLTTQDATSQDVVDITGGGANQSSLTGTTVNADNSPIPLVMPVRNQRRQRVA